jgi:cytidylate kinase
MRDLLQALLSEEYHSETSRMIRDLIAGRDDEFEAYRTLFNIAYMLASLGKTVLVGRGCALVTAHMPMGVHIRLMASETVRLEHFRADHPGERDHVLRQMHEQERNRARLARDFFSRDINDPLLYDAVFVLDDLRPDEVADLILTMVEDRVERHGLPEA